MENRRKKSYEEVRRQVEKTRGIYSRIGQPLAADVIIELYQHLGAAMSMAENVPEGKHGTIPERKHRLKS